MKKNSIYKILFKIILLSSLALSSCADDKDFGDPLKEHITISSITIDNVEKDAENMGLLTLVAEGVYSDSLLTCTVLPMNVTNPKLLWTSSDEKIATVTQDGLINAIAPGTVSIVVTPEVGFGKTAIVKLIVVPEFIPISGINFETSNYEIYGKSTLSLTPTLSPANRTYSHLIWSSSDENIATVDKNGVVTAADVSEEKSVIITAKGANQSTATQSVTIKVMPSIPLINVDFKQQQDFALYEERQLDYTLNPVNATLATSTWTSSDPAVASLTSDGFIAAKGYGTATITVVGATGEKNTTVVNVAKGLFKFSFEKSLSTWYLTKYSSLYEFIGGGMKVTMTQDKGNYRGDFALMENNGKNESYKDKLYLSPATYRYLAVKMIRPSLGNAIKGNIKLDTYMGAYKGPLNTHVNNNYSIVGGSEPGTGKAAIYYYDLLEGFFEKADDSVTPSVAGKLSQNSTYKDGTILLKTLQFVIADVPRDAGANYTIYWVRSFKTLEDLQAFVDSENNK